PTALAQQSTIFKLSPVLQSNMVVQQNKSFRIWGKAPAGATVQVQADWLEGAVAAQADKNNQFLATIEVPAVQAGDFDHHQLKVSMNDQSILLDSLLIGDVWLCSGQSNMQFSLKEDVHA